MVIDLNLNGNLCMIGVWPALLSIGTPEVQNRTYTITLRGAANTGGGGGGFPTHLWKTHFGVSDPNSFLHSQIYIHKELRSKGIANLTYASKFRKSKIYKGKLEAEFFGGPPKINRGT